MKVGFSFALGSQPLQPDDVIAQFPVAKAHTASDQSQVNVHLDQLKTYIYVAADVQNQLK